MIENLLCEILRFLAGEILTDPAGVQTRFVHADKPDGGEVIIERTKVTLGIWIQALFEQTTDHLTLGMEASCSKVHEMVEPCKKLLLILGKIGYPGHIERYDADAARAFSAPEEASALFAKLAKVKAQTAAHRTDIAGLHVAVDIV